MSPYQDIEVSAYSAERASERVKVIHMLNVPSENIMRLIAEE